MGKHLEWKTFSKHIATKRPLPWVGASLCVAKLQEWGKLSLRLDPGGPIATSKTFKTLFTMILYNSENSIRYQAILPSIVLSQQCCELYFISRLTAVNPQ